MRTLVTPVNTKRKEQIEKCCETNDSKSLDQHYPSTHVCLSNWITRWIKTMLVSLSHSPSC